MRKYPAFLLDGIFKYMFFLDRSLAVFINGESVSTGITLTDNIWHFVCVTWMSKDGYYEIYLDGYLKTLGKDLSPGGSIEGNGTLVIGQEQVSYFFVNPINISLIFLFYRIPVDLISTKLNLLLDKWHT